ncbi:hydrophobic surface binding protein A-domain-containing protein [Pseudomassariella vexata]|uniref:Hydrophobic surface binding protein A-domain-containing protein n=1 Tax=Pseudomassariella vexata TaxID=1141098 RepID=A0A1Y2E4G8_9PEZI|nr:hydrophobic surface binding protein A-domain-containing protein [Pseudomassariella vexata]ORY66244.1 hydrophobic surface binding protein A-domain-containing protein [Pseudomassariella vexata]
MSPSPAPLSSAPSGNIASLTAAINKIGKSLDSTREVVESFKGGSIKGIVGLLKINSGVLDLQDSIDQTTEIAQQTPTLNAAESVTIGQQFLTVQPQISALLTILDDKRPEFDKAGFKILDVTSLIRDDLKIQEQGATDLGGALIKALDPTFQPIAGQIVTQIEGNFTTTIRAYQGRGGKIKIPSKAVPKLSELLDDVAGVLGIGGGRKGDKAVNDATEDPNGPAMSEVMIPDTNLSALAEDENDLSGIPLPVLAILRRYDII